MVGRLAILLCLLLVETLSAQSPRKLVMSVGGKWPPYHYETARGLDGLDVSLTREILAKANLQLELKQYPAPRGQAYLKTGEVDLLSGASFNEERNAYARFSLPYRDEPVAIFVRKGTARRWPMKRLIDVKKYPSVRIAAARGGWYGPQYQALLDDPVMKGQIDLTSSIEARLQMLASSHVDMVIDDRYSLVWTARNLSLSDSFEIHPLVISAEPIRLMFSRVSVDASIVDRVDKAISNLKQSGRLEQVLKSFMEQAPAEQTAAAEQ